MSNDYVDESDFPEDIQKRLKAGMGCGASIGKGWLPIVIRLNEALGRIYPDYKIDQIKEKFGGLRYYVSGAGQEAHDVIAAAEEEAARTCDICGEPGELRRGGWLVTRCDKHAPKKGTR